MTATCTPAMGTSHKARIVFRVTRTAMHTRSIWPTTTRRKKHEPCPCSGRLEQIESPHLDSVQKGTVLHHSGLGRVGKGLGVARRRRALQVHQRRATRATTIMSVEAHAVRTRSRASASRWSIVNPYFRRTATTRAANQHRFRRGSQSPASRARFWSRFAAGAASVICQKQLPQRYFIDRPGRKDRGPLRGSTAQQGLRSSHRAILKAPGLGEDLWPDA